MRFFWFSPSAGLGRIGCTLGLGAAGSRGLVEGSAEARVPGSGRWTARQGTGQTPASTHSHNPLQPSRLNGFKYMFSCFKIQMFNIYAYVHVRFGARVDVYTNRGWGRTVLWAAGLWQTTGLSWAARRAPWCTGTFGRPARRPLHTHSPGYTPPPPDTKRRNINVVKVRKYTKWIII